MTERVVLVAGGAGFIGSHLCDRLVDRGDTVVCVDDFSSARPDNVSHLADHRAFTLVRHDVVRSLVDVEGIRDVAFTHVMHLASPASPVDYLLRPLETLEAGSTATRNLLDVALAHGARFFLASTSEVYGDPTVHPQREDYWGNVNPIGERSVYDEAKRFAEALTMAYHRTHRLDIRIARLFNTYGPRMRSDDGRVVTNFVMQALHGQPLTVRGDGSQTRSFCYVDDQVTGLLALIDGPVRGPVNIGNPHEITMLELAEIVLELTQSSSPIEHIPALTDDPRVRRPDITIARTELGWEPTTSLTDGLRRTIDDFSGEPTTQPSSTSLPSQS